MEKSMVETEQVLSKETMELLQAYASVHTMEQAQELMESFKRDFGAV
ncbi:hypothetical protein [Brevibacillus reuszeri]|nr:hypothetical protein [Brevibacillus reuszeri]